MGSYVFSMLHVGWWICLNFTSWEFLLLCQCSKSRSDEQVANPIEGLHMHMAATCQSYDRPALLLFWTRIYKVNFKFCNTLSNNMGKLFPQTKKLKKTNSKFKHLPCAGDHRIFLHVQYMYCTWLRAVSAARRTLHNIWEAVLMLWLTDYSFSLSH